MSNYCPICGCYYCECRTLENMWYGQPFLKKWREQAAREAAKAKAEAAIYTAVVRNGIASLFAEGG